MDSYLEIAAEILRSDRRPMTARNILEQAYARRLVPAALYGKTQHKTLQARLSEDILRKRENSEFFRTQPGRFFLREFIDDPTLPNEYRTPIAARRRTRDLHSGPALAMARSFADSYFGQELEVPAQDLLKAIRSNEYAYVDPKRTSEDYALIWATASVVRDTKVLCYRVGRYRDDRDDFAQKRSIAFSSLVLENDRSLFSDYSFGIQESALRAAVVDLDIPVRPSVSLGGAFRHKLDSMIRMVDSSSDESIVALVIVHCPSWFEPVTRRLSLNDLHWLDLSVPPNNLDDFDPWSKRMITTLLETRRWGIDAATAHSTS